MHWTDWLQSQAVPLARIVWPAVVLILPDGCAPYGLKLPLDGMFDVVQISKICYGLMTYILAIYQLLFISNEIWSMGFFIDPWKSTRHTFLLFLVPSFCHNIVFNSVMDKIKGNNWHETGLLFFRCIFTLFLLFALLKFHFQIFWFVF